jgi:hypothetical protein
VAVYSGGMVDTLMAARRAAHDLNRALDSQTRGSRAPRSLPADVMAGVGHKLWLESYKQTQDDQGAFERLMGVAKQWAAQLEDPVLQAMGSSALFLPGEQLFLYWSARWADCGFPTYDLGHRYMSGLMASKASLSEDELAAPWPAFLVQFSGGLLEIQDDQGVHHPATKLFVHRTVREGITYWSWALIATNGLNLWKASATTDQILAGHFDGYSEDLVSAGVGLPMGTHDERLNMLVARLIVGICMASQAGDFRPDPPRATRGKSPHKKGAKSRSMAEGPQIRIYRAIRDIKINCRPAILDYLSGKSSDKTPTVQVLVVGHWKSQPCGPGQQLRKRIHVEPYWRGPEDAPIGVRAHRIE